LIDLSLVQVPAPSTKLGYIGSRRIQGLNQRRQRGIRSRVSPHEYARRRTAKSPHRKLLKEHGLLNEVPVPIESLTERVGVTVSYQPFDGEGDVSGLLLREVGGAIIGVNSMHVAGETALYESRTSWATSCCTMEGR